MIAKEKAEEKEIVEKKGANREIVIPGETIVSGSDFLPGEGTRREGEEIVSLKFGLADKSDRLIKIIPLSGIYMPRRGNTVIGRVVDVLFNGWLIDIYAPYSSFLSLKECSKFVSRNDLAEAQDIGDMVITKVFSVKRKGVDLTTKSRGLGKLENGRIIYINSNKVPRIIGKEGSMINLIKEESKCNIIVGQNGVIWIKGNTLEEEIFAEKAIRFVAEKSFIEGLTEKTKEWFEEEKKKSKAEKKEVKKEEKK